MRLLIFLVLTCTLPALAVDTVAFVATPPTPGAVGQRITLMAGASLAGTSVTRYRFEITDSSGAAAFTRDWTTGRSAWWYPTAAGTYTVKALAKNGPTGKPVASSAYYAVKAGLSAVAVSANVGAVTAVGVRVTSTAAITGGGTVECRHLIGYRAGTSGAYTWDQSRPWGVGRGATFKPDKAGYYLLRVYARERGSTEYYDVTSPDLKLQVKPAVSDFTVTFDPSSDGKVDSATVIAAKNPVGGYSLEWKFWAKLHTAKTWTLVRDFAATPSAVWTPAEAGTYDLMVYAREVGVTDAAYDACDAGLTYTVLPPSPPGERDMTYIPAGEFLMGTPTGVTYDHKNDEHPERRIYLDGYWIMRDAVTVAQFRAFDTATHHGFEWNVDHLYPNWWGWHDDNPMVGVTWYDAKAYADWAGLVLPTEAQCEKAARGTDGRLWPWGNTWDGTKFSAGPATPVGSCPAGNSPYGVHDMAGNLWEWCADWYGPYVPEGASNPTGQSSGEYRVLRGGPGARGVAYRKYALPSYRSKVIGFRCVSRPLAQQ